MNSIWLQSICIIEDELNSLELQKEEVEKEYRQVLEERKKCEESYKVYSKSVTNYSAWYLSELFMNFSW